MVAQVKRVRFGRIAARYAHLIRAGAALPGVTVRVGLAGKALTDALETLHVGPAGETAHPKWTVPVYESWLSTVKPAIAELPVNDNKERLLAVSRKSGSL